MLSELVSDHTFIIVSCQLNSSLHGSIKYYSHYECQLENWNSEQRRSFIELFFRRFNKVSFNVKVEPKSVENFHEFQIQSLVRSKSLKNSPKVFDKFEFPSIIERLFDVDR